MKLSELRTNNNLTNLIDNYGMTPIISGNATFYSYLEGAINSSVLDGEDPDITFDVNGFSFCCGLQDGHDFSTVFSGSSKSTTRISKFSFMITPEGCSICKDQITPFEVEPSFYGTRTVVRTDFSTLQQSLMLDSKCAYLQNELTDPNMKFLYPHPLAHDIDRSVELIASNGELLKSKSFTTIRFTSNRSILGMSSFNCLDVPNNLDEIEAAYAEKEFGRQYTI